MADRCMVFFRSCVCNLKDAIRAFDEAGLTVTRQGDSLVVGWPNSPQFRIILSTEPHVKIEAAKIGKRTEHAEAMNRCDARFEIGIDDLDEALDEFNSLMEVQTVLQSVSQGLLFIPWNGYLSDIY